ncbi:MAG: DUF4007 family protein [Chlorobium sp.]|nr:DUF4007 family protein [Chlorobium sp.]
MTVKTIRVSTAFHETFALNLPSIIGILELAVENKGNVSDDDLKEQLHLGNNYIKAMPSYARATGLLSTKFNVTKFGHYVYNSDPNFVNISTLWLMHYHLSAPHGPGPVFWNYVMTKVLKIGDRLDSASLGKEISHNHLTTTGKKLEDKTTKDSARIFLRTYSKSDALGRLEISKESDSDSSYLIGEPELPSAWVIGYALADYWECMFKNRQGINLSEITSVDNFLNIFFMGTGAFLSKLSEIQKEGLLQVHRIAPPHQLNKLWSNKEEFLERIYA